VRRRPDAAIGALPQRLEGQPRALLVPRGGSGPGQEQIEAGTKRREASAVDEIPRVGEAGGSGRDVDGPAPLEEDLGGVEVGRRALLARLAVDVAELGEGLVEAAEGGVRVTLRRRDTAEDPGGAAADGAIVVRGQGVGPRRRVLEPAEPDLELRPGDPQRSRPGRLRSRHQRPGLGRPAALPLPAGELSHARRLRFAPKPLEGRLSIAIGPRPPRLLQDLVHGRTVPPGTARNKADLGQFAPRESFRATARGGPLEAPRGRRSDVRRRGACAQPARGTTPRPGPSAPWRRTARAARRAPVPSSGRRCGRRDR
jgi:hypothetical protein